MLLLPTADDLPQPSPQLRNDVSANSFRSWSIPALKIGPRAIEPVLEELSTRVAERSVGDTIRYWVAVNEFARQFVTSGQVFPHLGSEDGRTIAIWRGHPNHDDDFDRIDEFLDSMPPLARSVVTGDTAQEGSPLDTQSSNTQPPIDLLTRTLDEFVDARVRTQLADKGVNIPPDGLDAIHKEWLNSLTSADRTVDLENSELKQLHDLLDVWTQLETGFNQRDVRLCFRLQEPDVEPNNSLQVESRSGVSAPDGWEVELLLQSETDPSLVIEAARIWNSDQSMKQVLIRQLDRPKEVLFEELNRAASVWPKLKRLYNESTPTGLELTQGEVETFLREQSESLRQAGFGVVLPDWWGDHRQRLGVRLTAGAADEFEKGGVTGLGIDQLRKFRWEVVLDDESVSKPDLEELASLKRSIVHFRGQWMSLSEGDIQEVLEAYQEKQQELRLSDVLKAGTELDDTGPDLPVVKKRFEGELEMLFETAVVNRHT
jgi:non-specific serine/threonine protein kinase